MFLTLTVSIVAMYFVVTITVKASFRFRRH